MNRPVGADARRLTGCFSELVRASLRRLLRFMVSMRAKDASRLSMTGVEERQ
jgi:hypothetical protein